MHVHFVCTGNVYRSRLAEAYLRSKGVKKLTVSSSGIRAVDEGKKPISWYAARLLTRHGLIAHMSRTWRQTTEKLLQQADLVVFMQPNHYEHSKKMYKVDRKRSEVWNVPDLDDPEFTGTSTFLEDDLARIRATEETFVQIKKKVDELCKRIYG